MPLTSISDNPWTEVLDVALDLLPREGVEQWLREHLARGTSFAHVVTVNPEYVMTARRDPAFAAALRDADLATIDGAGLALAVRLQRPTHPFDRVTGVELAWTLARISAGTGNGIFLLGAGPGIADQAADVLRQRHPGVSIAGTWADGSPRPSDDAASIRRIRGGTSGDPARSSSDCAPGRWPRTSSVRWTRSASGRRSCQRS